MTNRTLQQRSRRRKGFSFIEIMVVLIIIAMIMGLVATQMVNSAAQARVQTTKIQIQSLISSLDLYRLQNANYPTTEQGLNALVKMPELGRLPTNWQGPYLRKLPADGWGNDFIYTSDGNTFQIISYGKDGQPGGAELDADITSDKL
ncbi:MAG: type II secretion system major pseudopilin GspG [Deltaproteobacteria bacterium]|nr:type II secretion system major pseudopilin GspG [Deltaproteobacteria bacterium]